MRLPFYMRNVKTEYKDGQWVMTFTMNKFQQFCLIVCVGAKLIYRRIFRT